MFSIDIPWSEYQVWLPSGFSPFFDDRTTYFMSFPGLISCDRRGDFGEPTYRTFVFESEEHYHWFLLKVM